MTSTNCSICDTQALFLIVDAETDDFLFWLAFSMRQGERSLKFPSANLCRATGQDDAAVLGEVCAAQMERAIELCERGETKGSGGRVYYSVDTYTYDHLGRVTGKAQNDAGIVQSTT